MSTFILKTDYADSIKETLLDDITETNDDLLDSAEKKAIAFMKGYLNARYDCDAIFSATGDDRDPVILMRAVDISLYYLHRLTNWRNVPRFRQEAYQEAKEWLEKVNKLEINPVGLPKVADDTTRQPLQWGSNTKRTNHIDVDDSTSLI